MRTIVSAAAAVAVCGATAAEAGVLNKIGAAVSGEVIALVISAAVALAAGAAGTLFVRVTRTFRETGEFLTALGSALEDTRITREELAKIVKEGKDIFAVWNH